MTLKAERRDAKRQAERTRLPKHGMASLRIMAEAQARRDQEILRQAERERVRQGKAMDWSAIA